MADKNHTNKRCKVQILILFWYVRDSVTSIIGREKNVKYDN